MTNFYVSNTYRFIENGESDMYDLLEMAERFDSIEFIEQQIEIIIGLYRTEISREIIKYRSIPEQRERWLEFYKIIQKWTDAWFEVIRKKPELSFFCGNQTIKNYLILTK